MLMFYYIGIVFSVVLFSSCVKDDAVMDKHKSESLTSSGDSVVLVVSVGPGDDFDEKPTSSVRVVSPGGESWTTNLADDATSKHVFSAYSVGDTLTLNLYPFPDRKNAGFYSIPFSMNRSMIVTFPENVPVFDTNVLAIRIGADSIEAVGRQVIGVPWSYGDSLQAKHLNFKRYVVPL